ncbi:hypothetical protein O1611_g3130 [Lasiodiplodia mahajangana]|uniref:Uncharacterized protein n=1 Tax=Lasiodiplodia mahajangana TaxID=1108764 RepID=A0ACC2JTA0_9PEZI|nr:hypothetical protein O1611_g3130 [Lasiodiplodia mahajangana]
MRKRNRFPSLHLIKPILNPNCKRCDSTLGRARQPSMDIIGSAAAVTQLLAQAISLWQQIIVARDTVKTGPKTLADTSSQLANLSNIVLEIEREPLLHTPEVYMQIRIIKFIATEICQRLEAMAALQSRSTLRQGIRAWSRGPRDEAKLADVLKRLENAKTELIIRMNVIQVNLTGGIAEEMGRFLKDTKTGTRAQSEKTSNGHTLLIHGNEVKGIGDQVNGIVGVENSSRRTAAKITGNIAHGKQQNIIAGKGSLKMLQGLSS